MVNLHLNDFVFSTVGFLSVVEGAFKIETVQYPNLAFFVF